MKIRKFMVHIKEVSNVSLEPTTRHSTKDLTTDHINNPKHTSKLISLKVAHSEAGSIDSVGTE